MAPDDLIPPATEWLRKLPDSAKHWYVEMARPGHDDEARVYGFGVIQRNRASAPR